MSRLPHVGGDAGNWGDILNDFLSQSHDHSGSLKNDTVGAPQLKPSAVMASAIGDGQITKAKLADAAVGTDQLADAAVSGTKLQSEAVDEAHLSSAVVAKLNEPLTIPDGSITKAKLADAGVPDGIAELDESGRLKESQIPERFSDAATSSVAVGSGLSPTGAVPASVATLAKALGLREYSPCVIALLGDSLWEGVGATTHAQSFPMRLLQRLRERLPTDHYGYYIPAAWPTEGDSKAPQDMIPSTSGTTTKAIGPTASLGMGRKSINLAAGATLTFPSVRADHVDIEFAKTVTTGISLGVTIDGSPAGSISTASTRSTLTAAVAVGASSIQVSAIQSDWRRGARLIIEAGSNNEQVTISSISGTTVVLMETLAKAHSSGQLVAAHGNTGYLASFNSLGTDNHTVTLTAVGGSATVLGARVYVGDRAKGIHVIQAGHGGFTAAMLKKTGNADLSYQGFGAHAVTAVICDLLFNDSGNGANGTTPANWSANLRAVRSTLNAEVNAWGKQLPAWVQVVPYEIHPTAGFYGGAVFADYEDAIYQLAGADTTGRGGQSGLFVVNASQVMPRTDLDSGGLYAADRLHYSDLGADMLARVVAYGLPAVSGF